MVDNHINHSLEMAGQLMKVVNTTWGIVMYLY